MTATTPDDERTRHGGNVGATPYYLFYGQEDVEYDQGHSVVVWYDDLVLKQDELEKALKRAEAAESRLAAERQAISALIEKWLTQKNPESFMQLLICADELAAAIAVENKRD